MSKMVQTVNFQGDWSLEQIEEIIKLRHHTFSKEFYKSGENDEELWNKFTKEWNKMQEYELFNSKQVKSKLGKLYKEYFDIQAILEEAQEKEIQLPAYWSTMVDYMPLAPKKLKRVLESQNENIVKRRRSDSQLKKVVKKKDGISPPNVDLVVDEMGDGLENLSPLGIKKSETLLENSLYTGLEKIANSIKEFGGKIISTNLGKSTKTVGILSKSNKQTVD